ncbi:hypothetical protein PtA15_3A188 [Puccinia triticina]|uniref:Pinin/SDK/MemA protein domain-containing protein n=1 Tax=Puccinia triticina TaxID=208348 RepID=A0ABY7CDQ3_9BASI|nr:uncharacterized protein PtA15_3A188 [Puccinia triticina]WAQ82824.1 hypothetical protein PtA15_3A188 [Puccinia triticina]
MDTNPKTKESLRNSVDSPDDPVLDRYSESKDDSNIGQSSTENPKNTNQIGPDPKTLISQSPVVNPTSYRGVLHGKVKHLLLGVKQAVAKSEQRKGNMGQLQQERARHQERREGLVNHALEVILLQLCKQHLLLNNTCGKRMFPSELC